MAIFQKSVIKKHLNNLDKDQVEKAYQKFRENYNPAKIEKIKQLKEEEYQDGFLRDLFVDVFGYTLKPDENYNLVREFKNQADGRKADGAILNPDRKLGDKAIAVIELKSTKTKDFKNVTEQAFGYKNNQPECKYVIISNFHKLRFYVDYANEFEEFDLFHLNKEDFALLYLILNKESIFSNLPLKLKEETKFHEQDISDKLYKDYSHFKRKLYNNLIKNNLTKGTCPLVLFKKSQKLLDRFLFILFAEDSGLLPPNSISRIIYTYHKLKELDAYKPIYDIYKQYFEYMNIGRKGKTNADDIPAYNGGLFFTDDLLDNLKIDDEILIDDLLKLSEYDFNTEVDVNILGHIFEHSLSEIEEITAEISAAAAARGHLPRGHVPLRKKDGIFYTPKYITQYIVENTIGTLCNEKRKGLEIDEIEFDGTYRTKDGKLLTKGKKLFQKLNDYKEWLLSLKILDPACGSGAFLNQALNFLIEEHKNIDDIIAELTNTPLRLFDVDKAILENNLYGVDINEESVEIAKLSLWLRTAQKGRKLSVLSNNIKCGNSLIDDPEIAGDKAFDWNKEFPQVFRKKKKKAWHITTATHNSRYSQRMFDNHVKLGEAVWLSEKDEIYVTGIIADIVKEDNLNIIECNICGDHLHMLLVCEEEEMPKIAGKIKAISGRKYNIETRGHVPLSEKAESVAATATRGHVHLSEEEEEEKSVLSSRDISSPNTGGKSEKKKYNSLWTQKFGRRKITGNNDLRNVINYIRTNRQKHELPENKKLEKIISEMTCSVEHAFRAEYDGGFDVVIGNPPYVRSRGLMRDKEKSFFVKNYETASYQLDLYKLFIEKSLKLINESGNLSFITPAVFLSNDYDKPLRKFILENYNLSQISTSDEDIFEDASVKTVVFVIDKNIKNQTINFYSINKSVFLYTKSISKKIFIRQQYTINESIDLSSFSILDKLRNCIKLNELFEVKNGIKVRKELLYPSNFNTDYKSFLLGKNINAYSINFDGQFIHYLPKNEKLYTNQAFRTKDIFEQKKLIVRQILGKRIITSYDNNNYYTDQTTYVINSKTNACDLFFLLSLMNSKLLYYYFKNTFSDNKVTFPKVKRSQILEFPIKITEQQQPFIEKADKMLALNQQLQKKKTKFLNRVKDNLGAIAPTRGQTRGQTRGHVPLSLKISKKLDTFYDYDFKTFIAELKKQKNILSLTNQVEWEEFFTTYKTEINNLQSEINKTDAEIDRMVYELYGLTEEEIKIVEE